MKRNYTNTIINILDRSLQDRGRMFVFAFYLCIKWRKGDSVYRPTIKGIMKDFGCGHTLAKRLYETATSGKADLFRYNKKTNVLVAVSWKRFADVVEKALAPGRKALMARCVKVYKPKHITIREAVKAMRVAILKVPVSDFMQMMDEFIIESEYSQRSTRHKALNQRKLGRIAHCHRSTVSRTMSRLEKDGELIVKRHPLQEVFDCKHGCYTIPKDVIDRYGIDKRKLIEYDGAGFVRDANEYRLTRFGKDRDVRNIIINHRDRLGIDYGEYEHKSKRRHREQTESLFPEFDSCNAQQKADIFCMEFMKHNPQFD